MDRGRFPFRPISYAPPREVPDVQKQLAAHVKAYEHTKKALELREAGDVSGAKREERKATEWLKEFVRLGGKVSAR